MGIMTDSKQWPRELCNDFELNPSCSKEPTKCRNEVGQSLAWYLISANALVFRDGNRLLTDHVA